MELTPLDFPLASTPAASGLVVLTDWPPITPARRPSSRRTRTRHLHDQNAVELLQQTIVAPPIEIPPRRGIGPERLWRHPPIRLRAMFTRHV